MLSIVYTIGTKWRRQRRRVRRLRRRRFPTNSPSLAGPKGVSRTGIKYPRRGIPHSDVTLGCTIISYSRMPYNILLSDVLMVLYNVYTLGYPDGFIQYIYIYILLDTLIILFKIYIYIYINNPIYSVRWIANISTIQYVPLFWFANISTIQYIPLDGLPY